MSSQGCAPTEQVARARMCGQTLWTNGAVEWPLLRARYACEDVRSNGFVLRRSMRSSRVAHASNVARARTLTRARSVPEGAPPQHRPFSPSLPPAPRPSIPLLPATPSLPPAPFASPSPSPSPSLARSLARSPLPLSLSPARSLARSLGDLAASALASFSLYVFGSGSGLRAPDPALNV